jgi:7-cyano-7-deazaguanine synthase in queuosine biosynthesis
MENVNTWSAKILEWGQAAIDDKEIVLDQSGRVDLFVAVRESLIPKENTELLNIIDPKYESYKPRVLLPFSGGLDSYIAYTRAVDNDYDVIAYAVKLNTPYAEREMKAIDLLGVPHIMLDHSGWPRRWEPYKTRWQHILPLRNLLIITAIAEADGGLPAEIWLGATAGEIPEVGGDKSVRFFETADRILRTMPVRHTLKFPLSNETKTELVAWWIAKGKDPDELRKTVTCQTGTLVPCGECHACFNRWVAMSNNGIKELMIKDPKTVTTNIEKVRKFREALDSRDFSVWSEKRILQTLNAWENSNG